VEKQIIDLIREKQKILILPSSPLDGDSLGSAVSLYLVFKKIGKDVTVLCSDPIPEVLKFLPSMGIIGKEMNEDKNFIITLDLNNKELENITHKVEDNKVNIIITPKSGSFKPEDVSFNTENESYDLIITVDTAELSQLKSIYENHTELFHEIPIINIDHHISNTHFGKLNYVDIMASSTSELLFKLIEDLGEIEKQELIDEEVATLLLAGIITDTGSFQNANTTPKSFKTSAKLVGYGARQQEIIQHIYKTKQLSQLKLWGRVLSKIKTDDNYRIVWSSVSQQDARDTGSMVEETGDIIDNLLSNAPGAEVVLLFKEKGDGKISVSVRTTTPSIDSSKIAEEFGGGGHTQAAGFSVANSNLLETEYKVIEFVRKIQEGRIRAFS